VKGGVSEHNSVRWSLQQPECCSWCVSAWELRRWRRRQIVAGLLDAAEVAATAFLIVLFLAAVGVGLALVAR
jgi:hypothetical protein